MSVPLNLSEALSGGNLFALPLALAGGVLAGMSPCCLALYPAAAGACCSVEEQQTIRRSFGNAVAFVLGVAIAIGTLGSIAAYVGRIAEIGRPAKYAIAVIPIFMGIYRLGWVKLPAFTPKPFQPSFGGAFGTGLLLSLIMGRAERPSLRRFYPMLRTSRVSCTGGWLLLFLYFWVEALLVCERVPQQEDSSRDWIAAASAA